MAELQKIKKERAAEIARKVHTLLFTISYYFIDISGSVFVIRQEAAVISTGYCMGISLFTTVLMLGTN